MNVSVGLNLAARLRRDLATRLFLILIIIAPLSGCYSRRSGAVVPPASRSFNQLKHNIVELRELSLKQEITLHPAASDLSTKERTPLYVNDFNPPPIDVVERAYKRIGLLSEGADFAKALAAYDRLEQMVSYDARERRVFVTPDASGLGRGFAQGNSQLAQEIPEVFGIVEALQEQNFHWHERLESLLPEDDRLASLALAKGDATLVALAHARRKKKVPTSAVDIQIIARLGAELEKSAADLPTVLREKLVFPYREGSQFVLWAYAARGWQGINELYADPPLSTSQILHPERYYIRRENPLRIFPWGLIGRMKESAVLEQTLGEAMARLLIASVRSGKEAGDVASAWRGDQLSAYQTHGSFVTVWISCWKNDGAARGFFRAYKAALETSRLVRLESSATAKDSAQAEFAAGRSLLIQVKGSLVLFLDGLPSAQSLEMAEVTWSNLETDREPTRIPLDLGQAPLQGSRTSR